MKNIILIFTFLILCSQAFGVEIFYPKSENVQIDSEKTFFIGNSDVEVNINGKTVPRNPQGAFAYVVELNVGENTFTIEDCKTKLTYVITRKTPQAQANEEPPYQKFDEPQIMLTATSNVPMRVAPSEYATRMSHLEKGTFLEVIGQQGDFYKINLGKDKSAWIATKHAIKTSKPKGNASVWYDEVTGDKEEAFHITYNTHEKTPYTIVDNGDGTLKLYFFNIDDYGYTTFDFDYMKQTYTPQIFGYKHYYDKKNQFIWILRKPPYLYAYHPLKDIKITLDPGHGGSEYGAISCFGDKEKDINLKIAQYLEQELQSRGAIVFMTRRTDKYVSLQDRVEYANKQDSLISVSIHCNAVPDKENPNNHKGAGTYYFYPMAKNLSNFILNQLVEQLGANNDDIHQASFAVTRNTETISTLVEVGYLINPDECVLLRDEEYQKAAAKAIADGIERFLLRYAR